jgi:methyl-accepting chemotaxis protein
VAAGKVKPRSAVTLVWSAVVLTVLGLIGGLILAYRTLHRVLGGEPADAAHAGQQVAQGKLDMHLGHAPANSLHAHLQHIQTRLRKLLGAVWNEATAVNHSAKVLSGVVGSMQEVEYAAGEVLGRARDLSQQLDEQHRTSEELARHVESLSDTATRAKEGVSALDGASQALSDQAATPSQAVAFQP